MIDLDRRIIQTKEKIMIEEFILTSGDEHSPAVFRYGSNNGIVIRDHDGAQRVYLRIEDMESLVDWWEREKRK